MVLELVTTRLELAGYHTLSARDGVAGLEVLRSCDPDAVILDLNMPKLDGFGVLRILGESRSLKMPRVMVLTARRSNDDLHRCISLGAVDYLVKPFSDAVLLKRVARLVGQQSGVRQPSAYI